MRATFAARYCKIGGSAGVLIPPDIRRELQLNPGDLMLMVRYGPLLIMRRATPSMVVERDAIPTDAIPSQLAKGGDRG